MKSGEGNVQLSVMKFWWGGVISGAVMLRSCGVVLSIAL